MLTRSMWKKQWQFSSWKRVRRS